MHDLIIALVLNERRNGDRNVVDPLANYPHLIATLAMQKTITIVKRELAAKGVKLHDVEMRDIKLLAEAYLSSHRAELIRLAIDTVEGSRRPVSHPQRLETLQGGQSAYRLLLPTGARTGDKVVGGGNEKALVGELGIDLREKRVAAAGGLSCAWVENFPSRSDECGFAQSHSSAPFFHS